jgi:hypothetical protein
MAGCSQLSMMDIDEPQGHYYLNPQVNVGSVNRIALLELENQSERPELSELLSQTLAEGMGKKHLFSVRTIRRADPLWTSLNLDQITAYSYEDLALIRENLKVDAIVFGTIKHYRSFPHIQMSLHLKMVDVRQGKLIWAMEEVWDSTDKQVELRMKRYFSKEIRTGYQPLNWEVIITSPRAFNKFVVYEACSTLPDLAKAKAQPVVETRRQRFSRKISQLTQQIY